MTNYFKVFILLLVLSGCATIVGKSDFEKVQETSEIHLQKCLVRLGRAVRYNDEIQISNFIEGDQRVFGVDKLLILQNLKKYRCKEAEFEDFAQFNLRADQLAKSSEELSQKMSCLKKDSACIGIYFFENTGSSGVFLLRIPYFIVHLMSVGFIPYYGGVDTETIVTVQKPQSPVIQVKELKNDAPYWSWTPFIFHPDRLNPRMATERAQQKQYYESIIKGLNDHI